MVICQFLDFTRTKLMIKKRSESYLDRPLRFRTEQRKSQKTLKPTSSSRVFISLFWTVTVVPLSTNIFTSKMSAINKAQSLSYLKRLTCFGFSGTLRLCFNTFWICPRVTYIRSTLVISLLLYFFWQLNIVISFNCDHSFFHCIHHTIKTMVEDTT